MCCIFDDAPLREDETSGRYYYRPTGGKTQVRKYFFPLNHINNNKKLPSMSLILKKKTFRFLFF
jgi:hypothetical protein